MGRDHAIQCEKCGCWYSGLNGPDECDCTVTEATRAVTVVVGQLSNGYWQAILRIPEAGYDESPESFHDSDEAWQWVNATRDFILSKRGAG